MASLQTTRPRSRGFTLIEILIAVAIIAILVGVALPTYSSYQERIRVATAIAVITEVSQKLQVYNLGHSDSYPPSLESIGFTREDPWGNAYLYMDLRNFIENGNGAETGKPRKDGLLKPLNTDYDLFSMGPDGDYKTPLSAAVLRDEIVRDYDGACVGIAEEL